MGADGNLISKGQGEGEAIMLQPFLPDQTPFNQMNQGLINQQAQRNQDRKIAAQQTEQDRDAWIKQLNSGYKYHPKDEKAIHTLQKGLIDKVLNYKQGDPKTYITEELMALSYLTNSSKEALEEDNRIQSDVLKNADKVWYKGLDEWRAAQQDNEATTYEDAVKNIGKRTAYQKMVQQGGDKINEPISYLDKIVQKASVTSDIPTQYKGMDGSLITKYDTYTDPDKLKETIKFEFEQNPEAQRVFGTSDEMFNQAEKRGVYKTKVNVKGTPSSSSLKSQVKSTSAGYENDKMGLYPATEGEHIDEITTQIAFDEYLKGYDDGMKKIPSDADGSKKTRKAAMDKNPSMNYSEFRDKYARKEDFTGWMIPVSKKTSSGENQEIKADINVGGGKLVNGTIIYYNTDKNRLIYSTEKERTDADGNKVKDVVKGYAPLDLNLKWFTQHDVKKEDLKKANDASFPKKSSGNYETQKQNYLKKYGIAEKDLTKADLQYLEKFK